MKKKLYKTYHIKQFGAVQLCHNAGITVADLLLADGHADVAPIPPAGRPLRQGLLHNTAMQHIQQQVYGWCI